MDISKASRKSNAQGRLLMTPGDSNFEIAAKPENGIEVVQPKSSHWINSSFRKVRNFFGGLVARENDLKLSSPASLLDVQRYEPKGFVGMTMRVLRRRFFNLWSRSPSSWTEAVSQVDPALPGTFASRKRPLTPVVATSDQNPTEVRGRIRRVRDAFQSALFNVALPVRVVRGRLGLGGTDRAYNGRVSALEERYSMQVSQSEQLGIFGPNLRRREEIEDSSSDRIVTNDVKGSNPLSRIAVWAFGLDQYRTSGGTVDQIDGVSGKTDSSSYSWIPWQRDSESNSPNKSYPDSNVLDAQDGWGISGYFSPGRDRAAEGNSILGETQPDPRSITAPLETVKIVAGSAVQLPEKLLYSAKGLFSSVLDRANEFLTPHLEVVQPFQSLKVDVPEPVAAPSLMLEVQKLPVDKFLDVEKDVPLWRWMIPNNLVADTIVNFGDSVKDTFWNAASQSPFAISTEEAAEKAVATESNESSAFSFVYDGITKTSASMTKSFFQGSTTVSDSLVALVASPPWETYYKGAAPFFENSSITATMGGIGDDIYKGILGVGVSIGVRKENVVSLVMEQDISDQSLSTEPYKDEEFSPTYRVESEFLHSASAEDASTVLTALSQPQKGSNPVWRLGGQVKDAVVFTVSGATKNVFPVTSFLYRRVAAQLGKPIASVVNEDRGGSFISVVESNQPAIDDIAEGRKRIRNAQLQGALSATMRVIPILRVIPPLHRWSLRSESITSSSESSVEVRPSDAQVEKEAPFVHVHVGDSERFYDLWKDNKESVSVGAKGVGKSGDTSFPFDEEAITSASSSVMDGTSRGVIGSLTKDKARASVAGERIVGEQALKEEKALQAYDPSMVPSGGSKVPFPMMIGGEMSSSTIDFIQQLRSPFFQNTNVDSGAKERIAEESKTVGVSEFARPVPVPIIPAATAVPKSSQPQPTVATLNATFPFAFPFETFRSASFRGFGGLSLPPATVRDISEITLTDSEEERRQRDSYSRSIAGAGSASAENDEVVDKLGSRRAQEMKKTPSFVDIDRVPFPTKADLSLILSRRVAIAVTAALSCQTLADAKEYQREIGLKSLISAITESISNEPQVANLSLRGIKGICRLIRIDNSVAVKVVDDPEVVSALCNAMEAPLKGFRNFRSQVERDRELTMQREAVALVQRIVRSSDEAVEILRLSVRLRKVLAQVAAQGEVFTSPLTVAEQQESNNVAPLSSLSVGGGRPGSEKKQIEKKKQERKEKKSYANTTVVEYRNQTSHQMARVASWGLGGVQWKAKQPGQKGLRILSFDGGGTRGVLSIAMLKEIMGRISPNEKVQPYELFDIICGTSTGGIIAVLLGAQRRSVAETEALYDEFIDKVFGKKSNIKLVSETAAYDELELEKLLYSMCGDELLLDSNRYDCSRVFCLSTKVNNNPPQAKVWRNYNYPPGQRSRYPGAFRINTVTAVRATSAAPTFFTPVQWEKGLYCDGALVANNPTAIALQEAKVLYPGVPVELVVSIGTGYYNKNEKLRSMGWDLLVSQLIASSTDTEDVHALLKDFLPEDKYFRFNPLLQDLLAIDEKNKAVLLDLKRIAKETYQGMERGEEARHVEFLINTLKGNGK